MNKTLTLAVLAAATLVAHEARAAGDAAAGEAVFKKNCMICHRIGEGAKSLVGPELNGLDGRHSGSVAGYSYSPANKNSGVVWNEQTFKQYIKDPKAMIQGTKMIFPGLKEQKDIDDIWAYVSQFGPDGKKK